jgi:hypothetical protein
MNGQEAPAAPGLTLFSPDDFAEMIIAAKKKKHGGKAVSDRCHKHAMSAGDPDADSGRNITCF